MEQCTYRRYPVMDTEDSGVDYHECVMTSHYIVMYVLRYFADYDVYCTQSYSIGDFDANVGAKACLDNSATLELEALVQILVQMLPHSGRQSRLSIVRNITYPSSVRTSDARRVISTYGKASLHFLLS